MKTYMGDRNEVIVGRASGLSPDDTSVLVIARTSTTYGDGVLVLNAVDGLNWTSNFYPVSVAMGGVAYDSDTNTVYMVESAPLSGTTARLHKSTDFGVTWSTQTITIGTNVGGSWSNFGSLIYDKSRQRLVLTSYGTRAVGYRAVIASKDSGATWETLFEHTGTGNSTVASISHAPTAPHPLIITYTPSTGSTSNILVYSNENDDTLSSIEGTTDLSVPRGYGGYTIAYSPLNGVYLFTIPSNQKQLGWFMLDGNPFTLNNNYGITTIGLAANSSVMYLTWNALEEVFFVSSYSETSSTNQTLYRTFKNKYGIGGWVYDPTPVYNTVNQYGAYMYFDPKTSLTQIYSHGYTTAGRVNMGYMGAVGSLPTPTPTTTPSISVTPTISVTPSMEVNTTLEWTERTAPTSTWRDIAYSPSLNLYVAVADVGTDRVMTSTDGITWFARTASDTAAGWRSVTWSPALNLFVAVAYTGTNRIMTSPNGVTWTTRTGVTSQWVDVKWVPELSLFVAVSGVSIGTGVMVMTSPNGTTWTGISGMPTTSYAALEWSPSLGMLVLIGINSIVTTTDLVTWTVRTPPNGNSWSSIVWSPELSMFVAMAPAGAELSARAMYSYDGINWTAVILPVDAARSWNAVTWSAELGIFVALKDASGATNNVLISSDGKNWRVGPSPVASKSAWLGIVWTTSPFQFVAVGGGAGTTINVMTGNSLIVTPTPTPTPTPTMQVNNTVEWTARTAPESNDLRDITYSPSLNLYVAVSSTGTFRVLSSNNGITWFARSAPEANTWRSVTWSPERNLFVAVAFNGTNRVMTSPNGVTWTVRAAINGQWGKVIWSSKFNLFVAFAGVNLGAGSSAIMTSPDGITWTGRTMSFVGIAASYSPELGIMSVVSTTGNMSAVSSNGITWTESAFPIANTWNDMEWSPTLSKFVVTAPAGANTSQRIAHSPDGVNWTAASVLPVISGRGWTSVAWSDDVGLFVAVSDASTALYPVITSPDGDVWKVASNSVMNGNVWQRVIWNSTHFQFLAVGSGSANSTTTIATGISTIVLPTPTPTPSITPTPLPLVLSSPTVPSNTTTGYTAVAWAPSNNNMVVMGGSTQALYSTDSGTTWLAAGLPTVSPSGLWNDVTWSQGAGLFVAVNYNTGTSVLTSSNGSAWTTRTISSGSWRSVIYSDSLSRFVAVASDSKAAYSTNGVTWTLASSVPAGSWRSVIFATGLNLFVAVAYSGTNQVMTSTNGTTWTARTIPAAAQGRGWWSITWAEDKNLLVAVSYNGDVMTSPNGITWTVVGTPHSDLRAIDYSPQLGMFVASGGGTYKMISSYNATDWVSYTSVTTGNLTGCKWIPEINKFVITSVNNSPSTLIYASPA